ncbi:MAG: hypothetical protein FIA99_02880 [Ruminiclostridium sp.]|nr:hypothetical protein [Ruminiclostridium sp.]
MQLGAVLAVMLLLSMVFVPAVSASPSQNSDEVSESQARQVAELFIKKISAQEIPEWDNAIPSNVTEYYNLDERLAAYSFVVSKDGLYLGYLLVSASKSNYPVLEFSKGKSPDMKCHKRN